MTLLQNRTASRVPGRPRRGGGWLTAVAFAGVAVGVVSAVHPLVGLAVVLLIVGLAVVVLEPDALTLLVVAVIYSNAAVIAVTVHGLPFVVAVAVPVGLAVPMAHRVLVRQEPLVIPKVLPLLLAFGGIQAASALTADNVVVAVDSVAVFLIEGLAIFILVTNTVVGTRLLVRTVSTLLLVGAVLGGLSLLQQVTGTFGTDYGGFAQISDATVATEGASEADRSPRLAGPVGETNRYAQVMVVLLPLAIVQAASGASRRARLLTAGAAALIACGIVLTYSRGAAVGLAVVLLVAGALRLVRLRWLALVVAAVAVALALVPAYSERIASLSAVTSATDPTAGADGPDGAIVGRATENLAALFVMRDHPLLGVGPGGFPAVYQEYLSDFGVRPHEGERQAHNLYVGMGAELGVLGLGCFLVMVAVVLRDLWRARVAWRHVDSQRSVIATGFLLALVGYLASGIFLHLSYQRYFWILFAVAVCASELPSARSRSSTGRPTGHRPVPVPES